ncbi:MAG: U32 family peptidase [Peptococcaceae bacterium]|nr:U32 family peptidase [Peptococcaceae bacterium]
MVKKPEILAPAGSFDAFLAAVAGGADAVYLGGKQFSARASAANFTDEELTKAVEYAHLHGVKVFVTMNTLLTDRELAAALDYLSFLYEIGIDAVILQDIGLLKAMQTDLPDMPVFASTQMSIYNLDGVQFLSQLGMQRIILARELSLAEITEICDKSTVDIEIFAHGALCICYSGQCLMSSMIGARSGNRGKCAQPCRLEYELVDETGAVLSDGIGSHLLSPKDLNIYDILPQVIASGIASLKIEGRMKRPEYVGTVVRIYREALDRAWSGAAYTDAEAKNRLAQAFNRQFTTAFLEKNQGKDMMSFSRPNNRGVFLGRIEAFDYNKKLITVKLAQPLCVGDGIAVWITKGGREGFVVEEILVDGTAVSQAETGSVVQLHFYGKAYVGDRIFKTSDARQLKEAVAAYEMTDTIPLCFQIEAYLGQPLKAACCDDQDHQAEVICDFTVVAAQKQPTTRARIEEQLGRLGGSYFYFAGVEIAADEQIMLPASVLNQARRDLVEQIKLQRLATFQRKPLEENSCKSSVKIDEPEKGKKKQPSTADMPLKLSVLVSNLVQGEAVAKSGADFVYSPGQWFRPERPATTEELCRWMETVSTHSKACFSLPRVYHQSEKDKLVATLTALKESAVYGVLVPNVSGFQLLQEVGWQKALLGDWPLNIFNSNALDMLSQWGAKHAALSPELSLGQIEDLSPKHDIVQEVTVFCAMELMVSEYCVLGAVLGGRSGCVSCAMPCMQGNHQYALKDKAGFSFPVEVDDHCRSHIFNSRDLCVIKELQALQQAGVRVVRLDLRRYDRANSEKITAIYKEVLSLLNKGKEIDSEAYLAALGDIGKHGFTKGHFYRGV